MAEANASPHMKASDVHPFVREIIDGYVQGDLGWVALKIGLEM
jgi:hypothetical protein